MTGLALVLPSLLIWASILAVPWQPWRTREHLEPRARTDSDSLDDVTVLIPARDEEAVIETTLSRLREQGPGLRVVVVDDGSTDATATLAARGGAEVIAGRPLPVGWTGKLWALEQGRARVATSLVLLLDADIALMPGMLTSLRHKLRTERRQLVSVMAELRMIRPWERLLIPAFIFFFKLLYPFRLSNDPRRATAAAAGGCVLLEMRALENAGGFASLRGALIDDCALARRIKRRGGRTWIGLSRGAVSARGYDDLAGLWAMVARSAFTQLGYSSALLAACTALMAAAFILPVAGLAAPPPACWIAAAGLVAMVIAYQPTLRYYGRSPLWGLALPLIALLYLAMTWSSAIRYWRGEAARWKGRVYQRE